MISCDTNILFAALDSRSAWHESSKRFLEFMSARDDFATCELMLIELYGLLRNPVVSGRSYTALDAAAVVQQFRAHPRWHVLDYPGPQAELMKRLWHMAGQRAFPYKRVYDARLALTLRHHGVTDFATRNIKDFQSFGFKRVWDPCA
ncbi:MAG TPA: VapC toxin family PIN domain ribonuclease [Verrucomicrobia bacterium]|nr:MAG: hypothetical protein A2X46_16855 [Lentisphaerae bacterium GWF2_57_35]HBA82598.1 VapC toxin family PIN domain ribonuclease [Verrucomicrobiota bacterium]